MAKILVLHGPNLNLLGMRETAIYGQCSLAEINAALSARASEAGHELALFQSSAEHDLICRVHQAHDEDADALIVNPAAFTHTSIALRDALAAVAIPFIEVHLCNPHAREPFRRRSYFSDLAVGVISGFGADSYRLALEATLSRLAG